MSEERTNDPIARELAGSAYRFVRRLATGGMGEVVVVEHLALGEERVMKLLKAELAQNEELASRLRTEARLLTRLRHPHLVQVLDLGTTAGGRPYLVTELLEGQSLKAWLDEHGFMLEREALEVARQTLLGLEPVHAAGIVHRDIKPDNLFYVSTPAGPTVKVLDFGVAKITHRTDRQALGQQKSTAEGMLVGTPSFLAPEQALGKKVDLRADLYSLGCTLYRLVTGQPVFIEPNGVELLKAHALKPPVQPSRVAPQDLSAGFEALVLKALAKRPEDRFESAQAMREAVEQLLDQRPAEASETGSHVASPKKGGTVRITDPLADIPPGFDQDSAHGTRILPDATISKPDEHDTAPNEAPALTAALSSPTAGEAKATPPQSPVPLPRRLQLSTALLAIGAGVLLAILSLLALRIRG
ncbi:MAG: protein kinase [Myxococcales bacterium]|nr:protein kinase [Myxococcales bacterium]